MHSVVPHSLGDAHHNSSAESGALEHAAHKIGTALTLGYVLLSIVGVVFETLLLRAFGTSFLTYAEPEDFLMAGLRHPIVLAFVGLSVALLGVVVWFVRVGSRLSKAYAAWRDRTGSFAVVQFLRRVAPYLLVGYYFFHFTQFYASHVAAAIRAGEEPRVRVEFPGDGANGGAQVEGYVVATTGRYVFLWQPDGRQMHVIPVTSLRRLVQSAATQIAAHEGRPE